VLRLYNVYNQRMTFVNQAQPLEVLRLFPLYCVEILRKIYIYRVPRVKVNPTKPRRTRKNIQNGRKK